MKFFITALLCIIGMFFGAFIFSYKRANTNAQSSQLSFTQYEYPTTAPSVLVSPGALQDHGDVRQVGTIAWHIRQMQGRGGLIRLEKGEYLLRQSIVLSSNIAIVGVGTETILRADTVLSDDMLRNTFIKDKEERGIKRIYIEGLQLIGNPVVRMSCIDITASNAFLNSDITIQHVTARNCGRHGIHLKGVTRVALHDLVLSGSGTNPDHDHNLYLLRVTNGTVSNVLTTHAVGNGFSSTRLQNVRIQHIRTEQNGRRGFRTAGSSHIVIHDMFSVGNGISPDRRGGDGIIFTTDDEGRNNSDLTLRGCVTRGNTTSGIRIIGTSTVHIENCEASKNGEHGIAIEHSQDVFIQESIIKENGGQALFVNDGDDIREQNNVYANNDRT